jgi:antitoxin VapB
VAFSIKNDETDRLLRELVELTGESLTTAVTESVRERLEREQRRRIDLRAERVRRHLEYFHSLPVVDQRADDVVIGYDERGLPT